MANVTGPGSSTDTALARWDGTSGTVIQDSTVTLDGSGNFTGVDSIDGNAATATALETARTIAGVSFDGTADIALSLGDLSDVVEYSGNSLFLGPSTGTTPGTSCTAVGAFALEGGNNFNNNTAVGCFAINSANGEENTCVGADAGQYVGVGNVAVGFEAMTTGTGNDNVALGANTAATLTTGSGNILIGQGADVPTGATNNYLNIGGVITGDMSTPSIALTDGFTATTQSPGDNSTNIATTAFVTAAVSAGGGGTVTTTGSPSSGALTKFSGSTSITNGNLSGDVTTSGTLAATVAAIQGTTVSGTTGTGDVVFSDSPALTGDPTSPTQSAGDDSTKIATTAFVAAAVAGPGNTITLGTPQATTSGTSINFTGIPSSAKRVVVNFVGVQTSGTSNILIQIGPSSGVVSTGYLGSFLAVSSGTVVGTSTAGFISYSGPSSNIKHGSITLSLENSSNNTWVASGVICFSNVGLGGVTGGSISLSGVLSKLSITTVNGTDTFAAGNINISYE